VLAYQLNENENQTDNSAEEETSSKTVFDTVMMDPEEVISMQKAKLRKASEHIKFPLTLPFSISVPRICRGLKKFIHDYYVFARNLPAMDKQIRKAVDEIMEKEVDKFMNSIIDDSPALNISQAVQIAINSSYLSKACDFFEKYASSFVSARSLLELDEEHLKLKVRRVFNKTMERSQNLIFELINAKIDGFLIGLGGNVEWTPSRLSKQSSGIINDLITYLETSIVVFTFLPAHIRQGIQFTSCRHIAESIMGSLLETKKYNIIYIYNLNFDVKALEEYAKRQGVSGLVSCFSELRQFIDLLLSGTVEQILDKPTREAKYPHLANEKLVHLLDKFKDLGIMQQVPAELPKIKRANFNAIIKRLKD
jgi:hypothetical protein